MFDDVFKKIKDSFFPQNMNSRNRGYRRFGFGNRYRNSLNYKLVSYEQARNMIDSDEVVLVDVRSRAEYEVIHIRNSVNIPVNELEQSILSYDKLKNIMVYCTTGTRSKNAIQILNSLDYNNIYIWEYAALSNFPFKDMLEYKSNTM